MPDINVWQISWHHLISTFNISNIFEIFFYGPKDFVSGKLWPHSGVRVKVTGSPMLLRNTQCISSKFSGILLSGIQIVQWVSVGVQPALLWFWQFLEYSEHNTACLIYKSKKIFCYTWVQPHWVTPQWGRTPLTTKKREVHTHIHNVHVKNRHDVKKLIT